MERTWYLAFYHVWFCGIYWHHFQEPRSIRRSEQHFLKWLKYPLTWQYCNPSCSHCRSITLPIQLSPTKYPNIRENLNSSRLWMTLLTSYVLNQEQLMKADRNNGLRKNFWLLFGWQDGRTLHGEASVPTTESQKFNGNQEPVREKQLTRSMLPTSQWRSITILKEPCHQNIAVWGQFSG